MLTNNVCSKVNIIPDSVIEEYTKSMNLLFPSWDPEMLDSLRMKGHEFGMEPPFGYQAPLYFSDFVDW